MTNGSRALVILLVGLASRAHADEPDEGVNVAEADALFKEAKRLMDQGATAKACVKFEASDRLAPGEGAKLNLAQCWEKLGKTASAWTLYTTIAKTTKKDDRRAAAKERVKALEAELVHLTIEVPEASELEGLEVTRNDVVVESAQWNQPVPVDPDDYTITAKAAGHEEWSKRIKVRSKDKVVAIPTLVKMKVDPVDVPDGPNRYRKLSIGLVAGGGGAIAIATVFAVRSRTLQKQADQLCPEVRCPFQEGVDRNRQARKEGTIANVGWGLGAAAIATGIVMWAIGGKTKQDRKVSIAPAIGEHTGLVVGGQF